MKTPCFFLLPDTLLHIKGQYIVTRIGKDIVGPERFIEQKEILMIIFQKPRKLITTQAVLAEALA